MLSETDDRSNSGPVRGHDVLAILLALTLFALYFITYGADFESSDGVSLYSVAESIAKRGDFDSGPFIWERWTGGESAQGEFGVDGRLYSKKGLSASLFAAPLIWLAMRVPGIGLVDAAYLFNPMVTAVTAAVVFLFALRLGYRRRTALAAGALFGVATMAWPYSAYFYAEPLGALFILLSAYFLFAYRQEGRGIYLAGAGLAVGWATITRFTNLPLIAICAAYALGPSAWSLLRRNRREPAGRLLRTATALGGPAVLCVGVVTLYNLARFADPFRSGYPQSSGFWTPLGEGLYGLFLSPAKSLFLFAPIMVLAPLSLIWFLKRHPREAWLVVALAAVPTLAFAKWMDWEGGLTWGPRFLVNIGPLMVVMALPLLDRILRPTGSRWAKGALAVLAAWSISIQAVAASVHFGHYLRVVRTLSESWRGLPWAVSPPVAPLVFTPGIITADLWQPAWLRPIAGGIEIIWVPLALAMGLLAITAALTWLTASGRMGTRSAGAAVLGAALLTLAVVGVDLRAYYNLRQDAGDDYVQLVGRLEAEARPGDVLLVSSHTYMGFFMNRSRAPVEWHCLLSKTDDPSPDEITLFENVAGRHDRVWLAIDRVPALGLPRPAEQWLTQHAYRLSQWTFSDYCRLALYTTEGMPSVDRAARTVGARLGGQTQLRGYDLARDGDAITLSLLWEPLHQIAGNYNVFVQLLDQNGALAWQSDRQPADGFRPTSGWRSGDRIRDNYVIPWNGNHPAGRYHLIVGMYDPGTLQRLPVEDQSGVSAGDHVTLQELDLPAAE